MTTLKVHDEVKLRITGHVKVHLVPVGRDPLKPRARDLVYEGHNAYTRIGYQRIASWHASNTNLSGEAVVVKAPQYVAAGSGAGTPGVLSTKLFGELGRVGLSSYSVLSSYTARLVAVFGSSQANGTWTEIGLGDSAGWPTAATPDTATSYTTTTLTKSGAGWTTNQWAGYTLYVVSATTGAPQTAVISSNTATVLTFPAITLPTGTVTFTIGGPYLFAHAAVSVPKTSSNTANVAWSLTQQYV